MLCEEGRRRRSEEEEGGGYYIDGPEVGLALSEALERLVPVGAVKLRCLIVTFDFTHRSKSKSESDASTYKCFWFCFHSKLPVPRHSLSQ